MSDTESRMLQEANLAVIKKIKEEQKSRRVSKKRAVELLEWWKEVMAAFLLPLEVRPKRMREVISEGAKRFSDVPFFKEFLASMDLKHHETCQFCGGTGWKKCWRCGGAGTFYADAPPVVPMFTWRPSFPCESCYGRGGEPCSICKGTGFREA